MSRKAVHKDLKALYFRLFKTEHPICKDLEEGFSFEVACEKLATMSETARQELEEIAVFFGKIERAVKGIYDNLIGYSIFLGIRLFVGIWSEEEPRHGDFFVKVFEMLGSVRDVVLKISPADFIARWAVWLVRILFPQLIDALIMTIGWVNELTVEAGYSDLIERYPALMKPLNKIRGEEHRHMTFYGSALVILLKKRDSHWYNFKVEIIARVLPVAFRLVYRPIGYSQAPEEAIRTFAFLMRREETRNNVLANFALLDQIEDNFVQPILEKIRENATRTLFLFADKGVQLIAQQKAA